MATVAHGDRMYIFVNITSGEPCQSIYRTTIQNVFTSGAASGAASFAASITHKLRVTLHYTLPHT